MAHYSHRWNCRICDERQESVDIPKAQVCDDCLRPLARRLCKEKLRAELDAEGINVTHWMRRADSLCEALLYRWHPRAPEVLAVSGEQR